MNVRCLSPSSLVNLLPRKMQHTHMHDVDGTHLQTTDGSGTTVCGPETS